MKSLQTHGWETHLDGGVAELAHGPGEDDLGCVCCDLSPRLLGTDLTGPGGAGLKLQPGDEVETSRRPPK